MHRLKVRTLLELMPNMDPSVASLLRACDDTEYVRAHLDLLQQAYATACEADDPYLADLINDLLDHVERQERTIDGLPGS